MAESLILIEHDRQQVKRTSLHAITLARQLGGEYALLVLGHGLDGIAASLVSYGACAVVVADDPALTEPWLTLCNSDHGSSATTQREEHLGDFLYI